jgi:hypothetical protein
MTATFMEHFSDLKDPRDDKNKKHELMDILFLVIAAVISGAEGWEAIEAFGQEKLNWLWCYPASSIVSIATSTIAPKTSINRRANKNAQCGGSSPPATRNVSSFPITFQVVTGHGYAPLWSVVNHQRTPTALRSWEGGPWNPVSYLC